MTTHPSRRAFMALIAATLPPGRALANPFREITWEDLIPKGVPYGEIIGPGQIDAVIGQLQREYDFVVVDLPRTLVEWVAPVVSRCSRLMMVTDTTVPAIRQARRLIDFYSEDRFDLPVEVVVNHEKKPVISQRLHAEASKVLERPLKHWLPNDPKHTRAALDQGVLLSQVSGGALTGAIRRMAKTITTDMAKPSSPRHPSH